MIAINHSCLNCKNVVTTIIYENGPSDGYGCKICGMKSLSVHDDVGFLYVLGCDFMPKIFKIGFTKRGVQERISELYTTGLPVKMKEVMKWVCASPVEVELIVHKRLSERRVNNGREFFEFESENDAVITIGKILGEEGVTVIDQDCYRAVALIDTVDLCDYALEILNKPFNPNKECHGPVDFWEVASDFKYFTYKNKCFLALTFDSQKTIELIDLRIKAYEKNFKLDGIKVISNNLMVIETA